MTTQGNAKFSQNNPLFPERADNMRFALAHNGFLSNDKSLRRSRRLSKTTLHMEAIKQNGSLARSAARSRDVSYETYATGGRPK